MQELLQQIDLDYYHSVRLLIVHAELKLLRQERTAPVDLERHRALRIDELAEDLGRMSSESVGDEYLALRNDLKASRRRPRFKR